MTYPSTSLIQCQGKHPFPTHNIAQASIGFKQGVSLEAYRCPHCGFYHVGHVPVKKSDFRRAK